MNRTASQYCLHLGKEEKKHGYNLSYNSRQLFESFWYNHTLEFSVAIKASY